MIEMIQRIEECKKAISYCLEVGQYDQAVGMAKKNALRDWLMGQCRQVIRDHTDKGRIKELRIFVADMSMAWPERAKDLREEMSLAKIELY